MASLLFIACSDSETDNANENENTNEKTAFKLSVTDAPIDDTNIEAVFVSFSEVKIDGVSHPLSQSKTIELTQLTEGKTQVLFDGEIEGETVSEIELIFDSVSDAEGQSPGCYVLTKDQVKHDLMNLVEQNNYTVSLGVKEEMQADRELVIDFDLRKIIRYDEESTVDKYNFATDLETTLRLAGLQSMKVEGRIVDQLNLADDQLVVFAYEKGSFDEDQETGLDGKTSVMFSGAVNSAVVDEDGRYSIHFLESGQYELKVVSYRADSNGQMQAYAFLEPGLVSSLELFDISLDSDLNLNLEVAIKKEI